MNYRELAQELKTLAREIKDHADAAGKAGPGPARAAGKLATALGRFRTEWERTLGSADDSHVELAALLQSPVVRRGLDAPALRGIYREVFGKASPQEVATPAALSKLLLERSAEHRYGARCLAAVSKRLEAAKKSPEPTAVDAASRLFVLGGMTDEEIETEKAQLLTSTKELNELAAAARLRISKDAPPERVLRAVVKFARRARANIE